MCQHRQVVAERDPVFDVFTRREATRFVGREIDNTLIDNSEMHLFFFWATLAAFFGICTVSRAICTTDTLGNLNGAQVCSADGIDLIHEQDIAGNHTINACFLADQSSFPPSILTQSEIQSISRLVKRDNGTKSLQPPRSTDAVCPNLLFIPLTNAALIDMIHDFSDPTGQTVRKGFPVDSQGQAKVSVQGTINTVTACSFVIMAFTYKNAVPKTYWYGTNVTDILHPEQGIVKISSQLVGNFDNEPQTIYNLDLGWCLNDFNELRLYTEELNLTVGSVHFRPFIPTSTPFLPTSIGYPFPFNLNTGDQLKVGSASIFILALAWILAIW